MSSEEDEVSEYGKKRGIEKKEAFLHTVAKRKKAKHDEVLRELREGRIFSQPPNVLTQAALNYPDPPLQTTLTQHNFKGPSCSNTRSNRQGCDDCIKETNEDEVKNKHSLDDDKGQKPAPTQDIITTVEAGGDGSSIRTAIDVEMVVTPTRSTGSSSELSTGNVNRNESKPRAPRRFARAGNRCDYCRAHVGSCPERLFGRFCYETCRNFLDAQASERLDVYSSTVQCMIDKYDMAYQTAWEYHMFKTMGYIPNFDEEVGRQGRPACMARKSFVDTLEMYQKHTQVLVNNILQDAYDSSVDHYGREVNQGDSPGDTK